MHRAIESHKREKNLFGVKDQLCFSARNWFLSENSHLESIRLSLNKITSRVTAQIEPDAGLTRAVMRDANLFEERRNAL